MALKRISDSSVLFIIGAMLVFVSFVLGIVGIATPVWTISVSTLVIETTKEVKIEMGLWRTCVTTRGYDFKEITFCGSHVGTFKTGWFQAVQTLEIVGLIFFVVGLVMTSALLLWSSNARLARANPWMLLIAGIFMEVGVIIFVVKRGMNNLGYSLYLTWIASNCVIVASIIIYCAEQRNRRPTEFTSGPTTSTPVFYPPPSNTNPVHISQPTYMPQPVAPVQPQPVQRSVPPYPGAFQVYPQQQAPPPYPQTMTYQPPATEHKFTDFQ